MNPVEVWYHGVMRESIPFIDMNAPDAEEQYAAYRSAKKRTGEVCACGHSIKYHSPSASGTVLCAPGTGVCACQGVRVVLTTSNLRCFMATTEGTSRLHALGKGVVSALEKGATINWVVEACDQCGSVEPLNPTALNARGQVTAVSTPVNVLLCRQHLMEKMA